MMLQNIVLSCNNSFGNSADHIVILSTSCKLKYCTYNRINNFTQTTQHADYGDAVFTPEGATHSPSMEPSSLQATQHYVMMQSTHYIILYSTTSSVWTQHYGGAKILYLVWMEPTTSLATQYCTWLWYIHRYTNNYSCFQWNQERFGTVTTDP